jgi:hypothetical protein
MKHPTLFLVILLTPVFASSQTNWEEYYPLHVGDLWEFSDADPLPLTFTRKVLSDTLMPNAKVYKVIEEFYHNGPYPGRSGPLHFERVDSLGNVYAYVPVDCNWPTIWVDTLIYKLGGVVGDTIRVVCGFPETRWQLTEKDTVYSWHQPREIVTFELGYSVVRGVKDILQGIGLVYYGYEGGDRVLRGAIISGVQYGEITVFVETEPAINTVVHGELRNFPNPFNSSTQIQYALPLKSKVVLKVFNILGQEVKTLVEDVREAGSYLATFDAVAVKVVCQRNLNQIPGGSS